MIKKILAILMAVIMAFSVAQIAFAADGAVYDPETGNYIENGFSYWISDNKVFSGIFIEDYVGTDDIIYIPKTLNGITVTKRDIWPYLFSESKASAFAVDDDNEYFSVKDGVLFSKDGTKLIAYPNGKAGDSYDIPEGVEELGAECFSYSSLKSATFPSTLTDISDFCFGESFNEFFEDTDGLIYSGNSVIGCSAYHAKSIVTVKEGTEKIVSISNDIYWGDEYEDIQVVIVPDSVKDIESWSSNRYLCVNEGSAAHKLAEERGFHYVLLGENHQHTYFPCFTVPTCISKGKTEYICPCGDIGYSVEVEADEDTGDGYGHYYLEGEDGKWYCEYCGVCYDNVKPSHDGCTCRCHSIDHTFFPDFGGIFDFLSDLFFRLKLVFWHLTGTHQYCECGCRHY